jgi:hypothetical protein
MIPTDGEKKEEKKKKKDMHERKRTLVLNQQRNLKIELGEVALEHVVLFEFGNNETLEASKLGGKIAVIETGTMLEDVPASIRNHASLFPMTGQRKAENELMTP